MGLADFLGILRRRWRTIVLVTVVAVVATLVVSLLSQTVYQATARLFVSVRSGSVATDLQLVQEERLDSYAQLAHSRRIIEAAAEDTGLSESEVSSRVSISSPTSSVLLNVVARDHDAQQAADIANAVGRETITLIQELETAPGRKSSAIKVSLAEPAVAPSSPASPKPLRNTLFALLLGLCLGFAIAVMREILDTRIRDAQTIREDFGLPVLGTIVRDKKIEDNPVLLNFQDLESTTFDQDKLAELSLRSTTMEEFRQLRTSLQFFDTRDQGRIILVTSCKPEEGKSVTAANLAVTIALSKESVLLVDTDLRRPSVAKYISSRPFPGLSDVLIGKVDLDDAIVRGPHLSVLPAGSVPPNPAELLGSPQMVETLKKLKTQFSVVILDSPPALLFTDPLLLAPHCGATVLVIRSNAAKRADLEGVLSMLESIKAGISGVVLNMVSGASAKYGYYGYGARYGRGGGAPPTEGDVQVGTPSRNGQDVAGATKT